MMNRAWGGDDLGAVYSPGKTVFTVWAPGAEALEVLLFADGQEAAPFKRIPMSLEDRGLWRAEAAGDLAGVYYVYSVKRDGSVKEAADPYAKAAGVNGLRGMVIDLASTDPPGFREQPRPPLAAPTDAIICELHIRDLSMHPQSGIHYQGKFLGLTEGGTKNAAGHSTGLDHLKELGVTHIHLLPVFDFKTIDEGGPEDQFNWGYDPQNYNVPEGSYATDPYHGEVRIREFKQMVQALHFHGLRVVMDVVYNHTYQAENSSFDILAPSYYYRMNPAGGYSNGSGCGNEIASERPWVRKFILDSVLYWAGEYLVDGFRFDLMGLHDIETMNVIRAALDALDPSVIIYGEGWTAGDTPLPKEQRAVKANGRLLHQRIALFSDDMRDGVKGSVFCAGEPGFINSGGPGDKNPPGFWDEDVKFGIAASTAHPGVNAGKLHYSQDFWAREPSQTITYVSAHDNLSLWDKLAAVNSGGDSAALERLNRLAAALVFTSQGIPFFQAGEEMARTKGGDENSYCSPDPVNWLDWERKSRFAGLTDYYRGLISLRKKYAAFRLPSAKAVRKALRFLPSKPGIIMYSLDNDPPDRYALFMLIFNGLTESWQAAIPEGDWDVLVNGDHAGPRPLARITGGEIPVPAKTALVLGKHKETAMAVLQVFYDYECPYCKRGYGYLLECLGTHPDIEVEWRPVEAHPRPENHPPHTDLCVQSYYVVRELGVDLGAFHTAMYQAVAVERRNVEKPESLADIVKDLTDPVKFRAILESNKYAAQVTENNDLAYEQNGVWAVPAFRMNGRRLDAKEGIGVTLEELRSFLAG
jgi:pullulanase